MPIGYSLTEDKAFWYRPEVVTCILIKLKGSERMMCLVLDNCPFLLGLLSRLAQNLPHPVGPGH